MRAAIFDDAVVCNSIGVTCCPCLEQSLGAPHFLELRSQSVDLCHPQTALCIFLLHPQLCNLRSELFHFSAGMRRRRRCGCCLGCLGAQNGFVHCVLIRHLENLSNRSACGLQALGEPKFSLSAPGSDHYSIPCALLRYRPRSLYTGPTRSP